MRLCQLFLSVDPSLGRVDYSLMSDQLLTEMLIEGFDDETKKEYQDSHGMYLDVCEWPCTKCDGDERAIEIRIDSRHVSGSVELRYVPPKVRVFKISSCSKSELTGSVDITSLPDGIECMSLGGNQLMGEIDLTQLPKRMKQLILTSNQLTGGIDLTHLPDGMGHIYLSDNQLSGEINLTQLPEEMKNLALSNNQFSGEIDLTQLPDGMGSFYLNQNQITGEIDLTHLPGGMRRLHLSINQFTGSIIIKNLSPKMDFIDVRNNHFSDVALVDSKTNATTKLEGSGVTSVVDENGRELDMKRFLE